MNSMRSIISRLLPVLAVLFGCESGVPSIPSPGQGEATASAQEVAQDPNAEISLARSFYFVFDGSGSMADDDKIVWAKRAVKAFIQEVPEEDYVGLYVFDRHGDREVLPLARGNRQEFLAAVDAIDAAGFTPLARAISVGVNRLKQRRDMQLGYGDFRLVITTDGQAGGIPDAARYADHFSVPMYTIGLELSEEHELSRYSVYYRDARSEEDLAEALRETAAELEAYDQTEFQLQ